MKLKGIKYIVSAVLISGVIFSCSSKKKNSTSGLDPKTGWAYNDPGLGGFEASENTEMSAPPGTAFIEGGRFTMGQMYDDIPFENNSQPRTVTVSSFYMDVTEVTNIEYRFYTYWMIRTYGADYPKKAKGSLPDTTVWRDALSYNEPLTKYYFRHAAYNQYPVVGVSWEQANDYCKWRTDRVNEKYAMDNGYLKKNPDQVAEENFNTDAYIAGLYEGTFSKKKKSYDPNVGKDGRNLSYEDGLFIPAYRLPTEAEWEFAARADIGYNPTPSSSRRKGEEATTDRSRYSWGNNDNMRYQLRGQYQGNFLANFKRGNGDNMGVPGGLNDNADRPAEAITYAPNAYGLYNMAGNVSEWTLDVYRPITSDYSDHNPYRGNEYYSVVLNSDMEIEEKDEYGGIPTAKDKGKTLNQDNPDKYSINPNKLKGDYRNYLDGDSNKVRMYTYEYANDVQLFNDESRIIKGGSWSDRAYWAMPGTRRYLNQKQSRATVGFRCVVDRLGSPTEKATVKTWHDGPQKSKR